MHILKAAEVINARDARMLDLRRTTFDRCLAIPISAGMPGPANLGGPSDEDD